MSFGLHQFWSLTLWFPALQRTFLRLCADWKCHVYELSVTTSCECDIWGLPWGNGIKSGTDVRLSKVALMSETEPVTPILQNCGGCRDFLRSLVEDVIETSTLTAFFNTWRAEAHTVQTRGWFLLGLEYTPQSQPCVKLWVGEIQQAALQSTHSPVSRSEVLQSSRRRLQRVVVVTAGEKREVEPHHLRLIQQLQPFNTKEKHRRSWAVEEQLH